jgi:hypothetical protein
MAGSQDSGTQAEAVAAAMAAGKVPPQNATLAPEVGVAKTSGAPMGSKSKPPVGLADALILTGDNPGTGPAEDSNVRSRLTRASENTAGNNPTQQV